MAQISEALVPVEQAASEPYNLVLSYPRISEASVISRVRQLKDLGVSGLEFSGRLRLDRVSLLGKGVSGMVVIGLIGTRRVALKIRRIDSRRDSVVHEAKMLQAANSVEVGPEHLGNTEDVLAMEFVEGDRLPVWLLGLRGRGRKARLAATVRMLLEQCYRLDNMGLDHGELSRAHKNVLVSNGGLAWILDFESASMSRKVSNFTSLAQYLFLGGTLATKVSKILGPPGRNKLLECLRGYKSNPSKDPFEKVLARIGL